MIRAIVKMQGCTTKPGRRAFVCKGYDRHGMATHVEAGWLALNVFSLAINTILLVSHGRWK